MSNQTSHGGQPSKLAARAEPGLYIVATPIGNAADITLRSLELLGAVDAVACEDTRVTRKLFVRHGISTPLMSYHDHNADRVRPRLLRRIAAGEAVALVSDAGTPLISDPGYKLVREAHRQGLPVTCLPGASAPLAALVLSGLPSDRFLFAGYPPPRRASRRTFLAELASVRATLILFESPNRLSECLADMRDILDDREACVARELTKRFEEVRRGRLGDLAAHYESAGQPKGEIVIVAGPPPSARPLDDAAVDEALRSALEQGSVRDAAAEVAAATGRARREVYQRALALAQAAKNGDA